MPSLSSPESNWDWRDLRGDVVRHVLGFFIGEASVDPSGQSPTPCALAAAVTTDPPCAIAELTAAHSRPHDGRPRRLRTPTDPDADEPRPGHGSMAKRES